MDIQLTELGDSSSRQGMDNDLGYSTFTVVVNSSGMESRLILTANTNNHNNLLLEQYIV